MIFPTLKIVRTCRGGTLPPVLVESSDGANFLVKSREAVHAVCASATDWIALRLARHFGITVPDSAVIHVEPMRPDACLDLEIKSLFHMGNAPMIAIAFLDDAMTFEPIHARAVPEATRRLIFLLDLLLLNVERTIQSTNMVFSKRQLYCLNFSDSMSIRSILMESSIAEHGLLARLRSHPFYEEYSVSGMNPLNNIDEQAIRGIMDTFPKKWALALGKTPETLREQIVEKLCALFEDSTAILERRLLQLTQIQSYNLDQTRSHSLRNKRTYSSKRSGKRR